MTPCDMLVHTALEPAPEGGATPVAEARITDRARLALLLQGAALLAHLEAAGWRLGNGWRGARAGVISRLREEMSEAGHAPTQAAVGPGIGPCCFEVGPEVLDQFTDDQSSTTWGTASVDLPSFAAGDLHGLQTWFSGACTRHDEGFFSHREDGTPRRMAALGWIP